MKNLSKFNTLLLALERYCEQYGLDWVEANVSLSRKLIIFNALRYSEIESISTLSKPINEAWKEIVTPLQADVVEELKSANLEFDRWDKFTYVHGCVEIKVMKCK